MAQEDFKELVRLYEEGLSVGLIAQQIGMSNEWTRKRLIRAGCNMRPRGAKRSFNPDAEDLKRRYQTQTMREIAEHYGVGETVVWSRLKELGVAIDGKPFGHRGLPGVKRSDEWRQNSSKARRGKWAGENNPHWKGGVHLTNLKARWTAEYRDWKKAALALRGAACQQCGVKQGTTCECCGHKITLHIHHLFSFAKYPEKRYDPSNSEVLCPKCHATSHGRKIG